MSDSHIRSLDLNLLRAFDALFEERNVTRAAHRLGLTQSALSHALNRLRFTLGDELFVRGPAGMRATPRAEEIGPRVREGLLQLGAALAPSVFVPADTERTFAIAAGSYGCAVLLPAVLQAVRSRAPRAQVRVSGAGLGLAEELDSGRADVAVGSFTAIPDRFDTLSLFQETLVWALRADHPVAAEPFSVETLCSVPHVVISMADDGHVVDGAVADSGLERRVVWDDGGIVRRMCAERQMRPPPTYHAPDAHAALAFVAATDMAGLLPRRLTEAHAGALGLKLFEPPYPTRPTELVMLWRKEHDSAALVWLRGLIARAAAGLGPSKPDV